MKSASPQMACAVTPFQGKVYRELQNIPRGRVITYKLLARRIGCGSPRAVGQALKYNPYAPDVPCHRVIASDLTIGGYKGGTALSNLREKAALLAGEGIRFRDGKLVDSGRVME